MYLLHLHGLLHLVAISHVVGHLLSCANKLIGFVRNRNLVVGFFFHIDDGLVVTGASQIVATACVSDDGGHNGLHRGFRQRPICDHYRVDNSRSRGGRLS